MNSMQDNYRMRMTRLPQIVCRVALSLLCGWVSGHALALEAEASHADAGKTRPRVGLVLSGGGARGLAHVGVLKVLEREHIRIDVIAGTSMGAIIGGLYASGMSATELERALLAVSWDSVFDSRVDRQHLTQRRKEEDYDVSAALEFGMRDGQLRAPQGTLSSRGLETLLRRYTLPVQHVGSFDRLPTPFRAISTDLESGREVILDHGDLAAAMRASMSLPGVFAPSESGGRVLGDGGLVNNLPIDVARAMGADVLIVVNVGTPLSGREALGSALGVTTQMINILTEQNVQRSLATLGPHDLLITPGLGRLGAADFDRAADFIALGEQTAVSLKQALAAYAVPGIEYAQWQLARAQTPQSAPRLAAVEFAGSVLTHPEGMKTQLESRPGQRFESERAERDLRQLAASGDYVGVDYHLDVRSDGDVLVFDLEDKPWGPNYFRMGLDLSTDFAGNSGFNLKLSHNHHWLTPYGGEWRNQLRIGQSPRFYTELYQPLTLTPGGASPWFASAYADINRKLLTVYDNQTGQQQARLRRKTAQLGLDLGQPWGRLGELRLGLTQANWSLDREVGSLGSAALDEPQRWRESSVRLLASLDQLDYVNFPQSGYRVVSELAAGRRASSLADSNASFGRIELQATVVRSFGPHTLNLHMRLQQTGATSSAGLGRYSLGGFQQLSGFQEGEIAGNHLLFFRLGYYRRLTQALLFTRGAFVGGTLEAGNASNHSGDLRPGSWRHGMSLYIGADTGLGPVYLGLTYAPKGSAGLYLFIGRP